MHALGTMRSLASEHETVNVPRGEPIFRAGDDGSTMLWIPEGSVCLSWNGGKAMKVSRRAACSVPGCCGGRSHPLWHDHGELSGCTLIEMNRERFLFAV